MFELHVEIADDGSAAFRAEAGEGGDLKPLRGEALAAAVREVVWYADGFEEAGRFAFASNAAEPADVPL